jgi:hypothetical protein
MEDLIGGDVLQELLRMNRIQPVEQKGATHKDLRFIVRLKIIFEQGYRFFRSHGTPPYFLACEVFGGCADYNPENAMQYEYSYRSPKR